MPATLKALDTVAVLGAGLMGAGIAQVSAEKGLNVLLNHNGCAALENSDPELMRDIRAVGFDVRNWSARRVDGDVMYHLEDARAGVHRRAVCFDSPLPRRASSAVVLDAYTYRGTNKKS